MGYINKDDFLDRLGEVKLIELTDREGTGEVYDERLNDAAAAASATFDSYALPRYAAPITATDFVKKICLDLAIYELASDLLESDEGKYKIYKDRLAASMKLLADIQSGKAALPGQAVPEPPAPATWPDTFFTLAKARKV